MGFGDLDREAYLASFVPAYESSPDIRWFVRRDLGRRGDAVFADIETSGTRDGGAFRTSLLAILHLRAGRLALLEVFAAEDLRPRPPASRPSEISAACCTTLTRRPAVGSTGPRRSCSRPATGRVLGSDADAVVCIDHRPLLGGYRIEGRDPFVDAVLGVLEIGVTGVDDEVLAVRGDRLCLSKVEHHGPHEAVMVVLTAHGRRRRRGLTIHRGRVRRRSARRGDRGAG